MATPGQAKSPYVSGGRVLDTPPLTVRISRFFNSIYIFLGLYFVSLFSLDSYGAAQASQFNVARPRSTPRQSPGASWWGGFGSGGGGGGPGGPGPGSGGPRRRIGRVDDIRGPECRSCQ
ncbi:hypothetical protein VTN31DRAFT_7540 [Thermomyces dupontii]|uniref:uncharacterized protein n=1 Tax=Talaromyces thermophilus TaxID=28565 RepID=UPI003742F882